MEISRRKLEILRRVVEEYVATGQPVGSKALVEGPAGLEVSSSTVRSELFELEAIGLLTHPHTSAGRVPTQSGYRVYTEELVGAIEGRPAPFPLDLTAMRNELEEALRRTTEALSDATHLLALVSAPALEAAAVRHVEVLQLQPRVVIVVAITASGAVSKRVFELEAGVDPGLVDWARAYLEETIVGKRASASVVRRAFEDPGLSARERAFLDTLRPVFADVVATATELYVGGAAGLLGDARGAELEACQRLLEVLERRAAVLGLLQEALDPRRPVVRVGPELGGEELEGASYVGAMYGLPNRSLGAVGLLGPLRMDYEKAIRSVRAAAFELSRLAEDVYGAS
jgi:heat-inducible transcriptional repressor